MKKKATIARVMILIVAFFNLQCAVVFLVWPERYINGFGLEGSIGKQILRAMGVLFLMWNIPYLFASINPVRHRISLIEANIMQAIGLTGEMIILLSNHLNNENINHTISRFIMFDGCGLALLIIALLLTKNETISRKSIRKNKMEEE